MPSQPVWLYQDKQTNKQNNKTKTNNNNNNKN